jgi:F0F1-type ATP synthase membrane subunit c/vacuolar-type H+-ATPase subunit K
MGRSQLSGRLFRIRLIVFELCETIVFVAFVLALAIFSIMHIIEFGRHLL